MCVFVFVCVFGTVREEAAPQSTLPLFMLDYTSVTAACRPEVFAEEVESFLWLHSTCDMVRPAVYI